jgi:hypothetical protein
VRPSTNVLVWIFGFCLRCGDLYDEEKGIGGEEEREEFDLSCDDAQGRTIKKKREAEGDP